MSTSKPGKLRRWLLELGLVLLVLTAVHFWNVRNTLRGAAPPMGGVALDGQPLSLESLRGQPVLVHFWATWCGVCTVQEPAIASLAQGRPVVTVASSSGSRAEVSRALQERGLSLPVLNDPEGRLAAQWGVSAYPTSFILDGEGQIRFVEVGYTSSLGLRARLWWAGL